MFKVLGNFFQRAYPCIFAVIVNGLCTIVYKKTDERYIEWQQVTTNDNDWYKEWQQVASSTIMKTAQFTFKNGWLLSLLWQKTDTLLQGIDGFK